MALIQIRIEDELKDRAQALYDELGLDLSTAIRMFLKRSVAVNGIPFPLVSDEKTYNRNTAMLALKMLQDQAKENGVSEMSLDDINKEIAAARLERKQQ